MHQKSFDSAASLLDVGPDIVWTSVQTKNSGSDRLHDVFTLPPAFRDKHISKWLLLNAFMCASSLQELSQMMLGEGALPRLLLW